MDIKKILRDRLIEYKISEVSDDVYGMIGSNDRVIMTRESELVFRSTPIGNQKVSAKPRGLWYGIGSSWIDWVRSEMPNWETEHVFKIEVDESKMRVIRTYDELLAFDKEYSVKLNLGADYLRKIGDIDWRRVASEYGGIEIAPYIYKARMSVNWYYGWDIASGCIWGDGIIRDIKRIS